MTTPELPLGSTAGHWEYRGACEIPTCCANPRAESRSPFPSAFAYAKLYKAIIFYYFLLMAVLLAHMQVYPMCAWCLWKSGEGVIALNHDVTDGCKQSCGCWELSPCSVFSATAASDLKGWAISPVPLGLTFSLFYFVSLSLLCAIQA